MKPVEPPRLSAKVLTTCALVLWLSALPLTGLVVYTDQKTLQGLELLGTGLLGPLGGIFAWLGNLTFFGAVWTLYKGKGTASRLAPLSFLLSLDTFRFDKLIHQGAAEQPVYGYGWGAILWVGAMAVIVVAAGARELEISTSNTLKGNLLRLLGTIMLAGVISVSLFFAITDRQGANQAERERLSYIAFKRGPVCRLEAPVPRTIVRLDGPLEMIGDFRAFPLDRPNTLLTWGIPVVRINNWDFSYVYHGKQPVLTAKKASGKSALLFSVRKEGGNIHTVLSSVDGQMIGFDQLWTLEERVHEQRYCPEYKSSPRPDEQPRKIVMSAMEMPAAVSAFDPNNTKPVTAMTAVDADVLGRRPQETEWARNAGCPENTGMIDKMIDDRSIPGMVGRPFAVGGVLYFVDGTSFNNAICFEGNAYLFGGTNGINGDYFLRIAKRSLTNFEEVWQRSIRIPRGNALSQPSSMVAQSLKEEANVLSIELLNLKAHEVITIKVEIKSP